MDRIHFEVLGNPQAQKRHRSWQKGAARGTYDPSASDKADFLALCRDNALEKPIDGAVILHVVFWMPLPKSSKKILKEMVNAIDLGVEKFSILPGELRPHIEVSAPFHIKRPDTDNLLKLIKDSMTGIYWKDDSQVQIGGAFKIYSHRPRTEIEIIYMEDSHD